MLTKRIIPCLDIRNGRTVKGVNFENIRDAGDPLELAMDYAKNGADELVFLDISATSEKRKTLTALVKRIAEQINIPFTVGGGISSITDVSAMLDAGADKVTINSAAVQSPDLIAKLAGSFGSQCIVLAIDAKFENNDWFVYTNGGRINTGLKVKDWARTAVDNGAGEILLTSMNQDGKQNGFDNVITRTLSLELNVPVIASGGAGSMEHFAEVFIEGMADAALAASVFHYKHIELDELKKYLITKNILIRN